MDISTHFIEFDTKGHTDIIDLTPFVQNLIDEHDYEEGFAIVFSIGSTCAISTVEYEPGLVNTDIKEMFEAFAPYNKDYSHNQTWGDFNGASHLRSTLTGSSLSVPFINGMLILGTWQQIIFLDYDTGERRRKAVIQLHGKRKSPS